MNPEIIELQKKWNEFSTGFEKYFERSTILTAHAILVGLDLQKATSVIEVGCGAGAASELAITKFLDPTVCKRLVALDLAEEMIKLAKMKILGKTNVNVEFVVADAAKIPYENNSFDRLFSSYCIHLVPDPDAVLAEEFRILQPGGIAGWSVWGRPENCPKFTIPDKAIASVGKESTRSPAYKLCDIEDFKQRVKKAGFSRVYGWYQFELMSCFSGIDFTERLIKGTPHLGRLYHSLTSEQQKIFYNTMVQEANSILDKGQPLGSEAAVVIAFK